MKSRWARGDGRDRGAAAVELAIMLPLLLLIVFGIIDFGRALNAQITLTQAAREGARVASFGGSLSDVQTRVDQAAIGLSPVTAAWGPGSTDPACQSGGAANGVDATVQVSYSFSFITPVGAIAALFNPGGSGFGGPITLTASGVMPCETT